MSIATCVSKFLLSDSVESTYELEGSVGYVKCRRTKGKLSNVVLGFCDQGGVPYGLIDITPLNIEMYKIVADTCDCLVHECSFD